MSDKHLYVDCHAKSNKKTALKVKYMSVSDGNKRERITIRLTKRYLDLLNTLIEKGVYNSRNEAIRDALRIMYEYHGLKVAPEKKPQVKPDDAAA